MQDCSPDQMFVIDKPCDVEFGNALQATTFLVRTGYGREMESAGKANSNYVVDDLWSAAREIEQTRNGSMWMIAKSLGGIYQNHHQAE
jgi:histidinol phosphatase-like enzyme